MRIRPPRKQHTLDMVQGPLLTSILFYSLPLMLSGLLQLAFNAADTIVVGRFSGNEALAAVGSVGSLNSMIVSLFMGISVGVNVMVAQSVGGGKFKEVQDTVSTSICISVIGGSILAVIGFFLARPMLALMGSPDDVISLATLYMKIIFIGMPLQMLYNFCAAILRAVGDTQRPLYFLTIAGVVNVILNLFFVIIFHMSVAGVALATIISQGISAALALKSLMVADPPIRVNLKKLRIKLGILLRIVHIGLPAGVQSMLFSISNVLIQSSVNSFGSVVIAGNSAASNLGGFVYQAMNTFQQAVTSFTGQNTGARKPDRVLNSVKVSLFWSTVFGLILGPACYLAANPLLSLFSPDPAVIAVGANRLKIVVVPYFLCGIMDVMTGSLRGIGYSLLPMIISLLGVCAFRVFWILVIFPLAPSMDSLLVSYPISWTMTAIVLIILFAIFFRKVRDKMLSSL